jgi:hypothetical protein
MKEKRSKYNGREERGRNREQRKLTNNRKEKIRTKNEHWEQGTGKRMGWQREE